MAPGWTGEAQREAAGGAAAPTAEGLRLGMEAARRAEVLMVVARLEAEPEGSAWAAVPGWAQQVVASEAVLALETDEAAAVARLVVQVAVEMEGHAVVMMAVR